MEPTLPDVLDIGSIEPGVGYVYMWVNLVNGKMYIGSHDGSDKHYKASGVAIRKAFNKYGLDSFKREFLYVGESFRAEEEKVLVSVDAMRNPLFYNMHNSSSGVGSGADNHRYGKPGTRLGIPCSDYQKRRLSETHKGKIESSETREKKRIASSGERNHNFGKTMPEEQKRKISESRIRSGVASGERNPNFGKPRPDSVKEKLRNANLGKKASDEVREKMSKAHKGKPQEIVSCPHCPKIGGRSAMKRYHFDNCKENKEKNE